jgi:ribonuclease Z
MSTLRITFLGTSAAAPTAGRNLSAIAVKRDSELFLVDCGEGTQRQMIRFGTGFSLDAVFFTHFHADHYLGIIGFLRTLGMQGRDKPLILIGPRPASTLLAKAIRLGIDEFPFPVEVREVRPGMTVWEGDGYHVETFETQHRIHSVGYALIEDLRPGRFDPDKAREMGVPEGPLFGKLQRGEAVTLADGQVVKPETIVGAPRPGRRVVLSGDTRPCESTVKVSQGADLLIHESTFGDEERERAVETAHCTAREAARVARQANVKRLVLTHLSSRYDNDAATLLRQAKEELPDTQVQVANDGFAVEVPLVP